MIFRPVIQGSSQIVWSESFLVSSFYFFISAIFLSISQNHMQRTLNYYVHVLDADKIATATVMGNDFAGVVSPACSGSCSGTANEAADNVILFQSIVPKKLAEI